MAKKSTLKKWPADKVERRKISELIPIEISPQYCDVIISRWEQFTGKHATLGGDGGTFTEIAEARNASG